MKTILTIFFTFSLYLPVYAVELFPGIEPTETTNSDVTLYGNVFLELKTPIYISPSYSVFEDQNMEPPTRMLAVVYEHATEGLSVQTWGRSGFGWGNMPPIYRINKENKYVSPCGVVTYYGTSINKSYPDFQSGGLEIVFVHMAISDYRGWKSQDGHFCQKKPPYDFSVNESYSGIASFGFGGFIRPFK